MTQEQLLNEKNSKLEKELSVKTRELGIQTSLEKIRDITMAMQHSEEIKKVTLVLLQQMQQRGIDSAVCFIIIMNENDSGMEINVANSKAQENVFYKCGINDHWVNRKMYDNWKIKKSSFVINLENEQLEDYRLFLEKTGFQLNNENHTNSRVYNLANFSKGLMGVVSDNFLSSETMHVLERFAKVFDGTYTRFLDLQKAEAQAREAQIQLALERVRARTMAMQKSDELSDVATLLFKQVNDLGIKTWTTGFNIWSDDNNAYEDWIASPAGGFIQPYVIDATAFSEFKTLSDAKKSGTDFFILYQEGQTLKETYKQLSRFANKNQFEKILDEGFQFPSRQFVHMVFGLKVSLMFITYDPVPEAHGIFKRFGKVFEQTYTRFLDLQKAEAQARESQIELGLERVRARAMGMQKSDELKELIGTVFTELTKLDLVLTRCVIMIYDTKTLGITWWMANSEDPSNPGGLFVKYHQLPPHMAYIKAWRERDLKWQYLLKGKIKKEWDDFLFAETELSHLPDFVIAGMKSPDRVYLNASFNSFGNLTLASLEQLSNEHFDILLRFAKVFDLTYTRFNDLQKAEAQAREAQIEAALERVRARTMAMQKSEELAEVANLLFQQVQALDLPLLSSGYNIWEKDDKVCTAWMSDQSGLINPSFKLPLTESPMVVHFFTSHQSGESFYAEEVSGEELAAHYRYMLTLPVFDKIIDGFLKAGFTLPTFQVNNVANFLQGNLIFITYKPVPEAHDMFKRFAKVFEQTYTRFLDLQKAEAQTREAKIEASLERVRGKAMAMHSSRDLADTIDVFYHEMQLLSITPRRCGVGLMDKETHMVELSTMNTTEQGESVEVIGKLKLTGHPVLEGIYDNWILQKEYRPVLRGNEIKKYYELIRPQIGYPDYPTDSAQYGYFFFFNEGGVYAWTEKELSDDELKIYRRFTSVLSLTYKRYKDLKDAEANGREAIKRASLDRVRAETASMRTTGDLEKITPLIWNELTTLNVPFIRCGVFIMDEEQELIHSFLSTPEGKAIAAFQLPFDTAGELSKVLTHWHKNEIFKDHWDEAAFAEWTKSLVEQGAIGSEETYSKAHRPVNLHLHFLPFLQGMLYVGSEAPLNDEEINLVQTLADAFSTAYARYEDFNKLESAKAQIEKTLVDLKQAQAQLVQSEKMASLGELTAGIAHEIQNPLNFVNNFSDVNTELIDELNAERLKPNAERDEQLETEILNDIKENEQKINHHGKRADAIVKGMLQHSRKTSGQKEPTDINALADEYLRLSYHGLRAKDKTFNAEMKTDFDGSIGKINIIPQDIGRVFLNLFNNAFYAVAEKKKLFTKDLPGFKNLEGLNAYQPTICLITKRSEHQVTITVIDNGNGIPQNIVDKIFQPFFTTKPTGEGTGLGLSLAYDIIKAHGGTLKVESKEGEGSEFVIQLPGV